MDNTKNLVNHISSQNNQKLRIWAVYLKILETMEIRKPRTTSYPSPSSVAMIYIGMESLHMMFDP